MKLKFKVKGKEIWLVKCKDGWLAEWMENGKLKFAEVKQEK